MSRSSVTNKDPSAKRSETSAPVVRDIAALEAREKELRATEPDALAYIDALNELAWELGWSDSERSVRLARRAEKLALAADYEPGRGAAMRTRAYNLLLKSKFIEAVRLSLEAIQVLESYEAVESRPRADDPAAPDVTLLLAGAYNNISSSYLFVGDFEAALQHAERAGELFERASDVRGTGWSHYNKGFIFGRLGDVTAAAPEFERALVYFRGIDYTPGEARVMDSMGQMFETMGQYDRALECQRRGFELARDNGFEFSMFSSLAGIARIELARGDYGAATERLNEFFDICKPDEHPAIHTGALLVRGRLHRLQGRLDAAGVDLRGALDRAMTMEARQVQQDVHRELSWLEEDMGRHEQALGHSRKAEEIREAIQGEEVRGRMRGFQIGQALRGVERERELEKVRRQETEKLLMAILPRTAAEELIARGKVRPVRIPAATVLFADFTGFTRTASNLKPERLVRELDRCFSAFDRIMRRFGLEKLKTIGDGYMAVAGAPEPDGVHALRATLAGLAMLAEMKKLHAAGKILFRGLRVGLNSGPIVAGVIGKDKFAYDIWGDTVNLASRMESASRPGRLNLSRATYVAVQEYFNCTARGGVRIKEDVKLPMYFVRGLKARYARADGRTPNAALNRLLRG